jgi:hypothetical protein
MVTLPYRSKKNLFVHLIRRSSLLIGLVTIGLVTTAFSVALPVMLPVLYSKSYLNAMGIPAR